jgi:hypothetical protein
LGEWFNTSLIFGHKMAPANLQFVPSGKIAVTNDWAPWLQPEIKLGRFICHRKKQGKSCADLAETHT